MKKWKKLLLVGGCSLFLQLFHWLIYQWVSFPAGLLFLTPLLLCAVYHVYQSDTAESRGLRRLEVFFSGVLIPFLLCALFSGILFLQNPDLYLYHANMLPTGGRTETIALYAGRMMLTSCYVLVFSGLDVLLLRLQDHHLRQKQEGAAE